MREWSSNGSWTWNTTGNVAGNYTITVWARLKGSTADWEAFKETPYTLVAPPPPPPPPPCTSVNVTTSVTSPQQPGVPVTFTATAAGCATPEYKIWRLAPNVGWTIMREWSTNSSWTWDTTGNVAGNYTITVWARLKGSTADWETFKETPLHPAVGDLTPWGVAPNLNPVCVRTGFSGKTTISFGPMTASGDLKNVRKGRGDVTLTPSM